MPRRHPISLLVAGALILALPAAAEIYTVTLTNDSTFETRYRPLADPQNAGKLLMLTDQGNWISLPLDIVASVASETESRGFGLVVDTRTIDLGYTLNDAAVPEEGAAPDPATQLLRYLEGQERAPYSVQQFVEPEEAGGIPVDFTRTTTPPIGAVSRFLQPAGSPVGTVPE